MAPAPDDSAREVAPRRALFYGDSLVAGVGDHAGGGWVARVAAACCASGVPLTVYNLGVRRETSQQVAARFRAEAIPRVPAGAHCRVVLSFGANDTTVEGGAVRVSVEDSQRALVALLEQADALGFPALVVSAAPLDDPAHNRRIAELMASFADICRARGTPFIDVMQPLLDSSVWIDEVRRGDGAHPGAWGYDLLAELLIERDLVAWLTAA
jgi:acyl-CoA thioesterase I